uniref:Zinc finger protein, FOG family member 1 n=1 Tax=Poecilia formosa TaxID=48698 RepID=A0A087XB33_POEFO
NCSIYSRGEELFCKVTREVRAGGKLLASLTPQLSPPLQPAVKEEPLYPAALRSDIQLLPQQAGMAAILATAVVNKDIFPCKDCGIWYRSERNLQAHLMYYCASRQKQPAAASSPPQDKPKESYPNERICPFPQCNKSCPSASSLEIHMRTHSDTSNSDSLSPGDSGVVLKCQVCGHNSDSPAQLQQHVRTHLEVRVPAERSPTPRQSTPSSAEQPQLSPHEREPLACVPKPDSSSPGANGGSATPRDFSSPDAQTSELKIKEEPQSESETEEQQMEMKEDGEEEGVGGEDPDQETPNSPKSPPNPTVKAEPTSPTPGSSPAHAGGTGSGVAGGSIFLPQYMFNPEAAILPQASEILAKMSEMVHSRLKQGQAVVQSNPAAFFTSGPKGATCFECDITFNNINNYYAHKRLYCSSRHQGEGASSASGSGVSAPAASGGLPSSSPQIGASSRAASVSPTNSEPPAGTRVAESKRLVEVKTETPAGKEGVSSSSEGEGGGGGRASEGSQSPASGSTEDMEDDPNKTFCEACNIRFSRHDNYTIHKRFYCASRHDPSNQRATHMSKTSNTAAFLPQPIRTRKRKKMYEIHMARTEALANAAAAATTSGASAPSPSVLGLVVKQEVSPGGVGGSSPEGDGPIDLSKRPRLRETPRHNSGGSILPALPLTDYHKCTACSISFNSIENYLAHKTYYCPATTLQPHTLEQLHRLKSPRPSALPASGAASPSHATLAATPGAGAKGAAASSSLAVCPYCPNRPITCDLVEHFKTTHGLVLTVQPPPETPQRPSRAVSRSPSLSPRDGVTGATTPTYQAKMASRVHRDSVNGQTCSGAASPASPQVNGSPSAGGGSPSSASPLPVSPPRAPSLTVSPVPEAPREKVAPVHLPESTASNPIAGPKMAVISPVQNGNSRFCRLCNIKFSSLSTFIAHKKYYCSSHSAEHVK